MGTSQHPNQAPTTDFSAISSHPHNWPLCNSLLPAVCSSPNMAHTRTIPDPHPLLKRRYIRHTIPAIKLDSLSASLVTLRILLSSTPTQIAKTPSNKKIHIRLSPTRHHFPRRIRSIRNRSTRLLHPLPRHYKHPPNPRLQLPHPTISRLRTSNGSWLRLERILSQPPIQRRAQQRRHGQGNHHRRWRRTGISRCPAQHTPSSPTSEEGLCQTRHPLWRRSRSRLGIW